MSDEHDIDVLRFRRALRKDLAALRSAAQARMSADTPETAKARLVRQREDWATLMREGRLALAASEPEIDRLLRFDDRFTALLRKRKR